ncbi:MAG: hypothetical protein ACYTGX_06455 [Planctomycetota bacterium]
MEVQQVAFNACGPFDERHRPLQSEACRHLLQYRTRIVHDPLQQTVRARPAARRRFRLDDMFEPEQMAGRRRQPVHALERPRHRLGMADQPDEARLPSGRLEARHPKREQPAQPGVLEAAQPLAAERLSKKLRRARGQRRQRRPTPPLGRHRTHVMPLPPQRGEQRLIDGDQFGVLPESAGVDLRIRRQQVLTERHPGRRQRAGQRRGSAAVRPQHHDRHPCRARLHAAIAHERGIT